MTKTKKNVDLVADFNKESKNTKYLLVSSFVFLVSSILPWFSWGLGITVNGWMGILIIANIASILILTFWVLSQLKIDLGDLTKKLKLINKILASLILGSVLLFIIQTRFSFNVFGLGFYLGFFSSFAAVFFAFELKIEDIKKEFENVIKKIKKNKK